MLHADSATVDWNADRKRWEIRILVGAEVIKRPIENRLAETGEAALKELACTTARDEGYQVEPEQVAIHSH